LTNAVKHGQATLIRVLAEVVGERLYLRIQDNGSGAEHYRPGMGLTGMVRRVQSIGGTLRFQTAVNAGFLIEIGVKLQ
jgi:signal transduction histidine kinase